VNRISHSEARGKGTDGSGTGSGNAAVETRTRGAQMPPITLPEATFAILWEKAGLGDLPRALFVPSPGATGHERAALERAAALELVRQGIGYGGAADEEVERALGVLARPAVEHYGWVVPPGGDAVGFVAAGDGRQTVLAKLADGFVWLSPAGRREPAPALCQELPIETSAPAAEVTLPRDSARLAELVAPPLAVRAQFFSSVRGRDGRRRRVERPIHYVRSRLGAWLLHTLSGHDRITVVPASPAALADALDQTSHRLHPAARAGSPPVDPGFPHVHR
jgi:ESX secretion-associated protein EspG